MSKKVDPTVPASTDLDWAAVESARTTFEEARARLRQLRALEEKVDLEIKRSDSTLAPIIEGTKRLVEALRAPGLQRPKVGRPPVG